MTSRYSCSRMQPPCCRVQSPVGASPACWGASFSSADASTMLAALICLINCTRSSMSSRPSSAVRIARSWMSWPMTSALLAMLVSGVSFGARDRFATMVLALRTSSRVSRWPSVQPSFLMDSRQANVTLSSTRCETATRGVLPTSSPLLSHQSRLSPASKEAKPATKRSSSSRAIWL